MVSCFGRGQSGLIGCIETLRFVLGCWLIEPWSFFEKIKLLPSDGLKEQDVRKQAHGSNGWWHRETGEHLQRTRQWSNALRLGKSQREQLSGFHSLETEGLGDSNSVRVTSSGGIDAQCMKGGNTQSVFVNRW